MKTQKQLFEEARKQHAETNKAFMFFVKDGLTQEELKVNIKRRPELWGRFSNWLDKLPRNSLD